MLQDYPIVHRFLEAELGGDVTNNMTYDDAMRALRHKVEPVWSLEKVGKAFGVSRERVRQIAGTSQRAPRLYWTDDMDNIVRKNVDKTAAEIAGMLGVRESAASTRRRVLGFNSGWTDEDEAVLRKNMHLTDAKLGELVNRRAGTVREKRLRMNLKKRSKRMWTDDEVEFLRQNWMSMTFAKMGEALERTGGSIGGKMRQIGLSPAP